MCLHTIEGSVVTCVSGPEILFLPESFTAGKSKYYMNFENCMMGSKSANQTFSFKIKRKSRQLNTATVLLIPYI